MTTSRLGRALVLGVLLACVACATAGASPSVVRIELLSNRADLVAGGQALVSVSPPSGVNVSALRLDLNGRDVTRDFASRVNGSFEGLIAGLHVGRNVLSARLPDGRGAHLTITNHQIGGPVFAGPQVQPWLCGTVAVGLGPATDAQCNAPTSITYQYKSSANGQFSAYNPSSPPPDVAMTTTDTGATVPYIVRIERGTADRGIYEIGVLADPSKPWLPWASQPGWNHKLIVPFGASTAPHHSQDPPSGVITPSSPVNQMYDDSALSRGFMIADSGLNIQGSDPNIPVSAEALVMLKEHITETYGPIRHTIGSGCSGGGLQQYMVSATYPGLLNAILPNCSFPDMWTTALDVAECHGIATYFKNNPSQPWVPSIDGHRDPSDCAAWDQLFFSVGDPNKAANCNLPQADVYDPKTNPRGARCDLQDYQVAIWGPRPQSDWGPVEKGIRQGFAQRPADNVGVQYGLQALNSGQISAAEFADLNAKLGGVDIDNQSQPQRSSMSDPVAAIAYRTGQILDPRQIADVPIIDLRAYSESGEIHTSFYSYSARARLDKANGNHANQVIWTFPAAFPILGVVPPPDIWLKAVLAVDQWLTTVEADHSGATLAQKVARAKPGGAVDGCFPENTSVMVTDPSTCSTTFPSYGNTRTAAGAPVANDVIKCQRKPFDAHDYKVTFTPAELEQLHQAFPTGVCDWSKASVGEQRSIPWMSFAAGPGGQPLGPAPMSIPFGPTPSAVPRCPARALTFAVSAPHHARIDQARVYLDGRSVRIVRAPRGRSLHAVTVRGLPSSGTHVLRIDTFSGRQRVRRSVRTLRGCRAKGAPKVRGRRPGRRRRARPG